MKKWKVETVTGTNSKLAAALQRIEGNKDTIFQVSRFTFKTENRGHIWEDHGWTIIYYTVCPENGQEES